MQRCPRTACLRLIFGTQALTLSGRLSLNNQIFGSEEAAIRLPKRLRFASSWGCLQTELVGHFKKALTSWQSKWSCPIASAAGATEYSVRLGTETHSHRRRVTDLSRALGAPKNWKLRRQPCRNTGGLDCEQ